ncbi:MAG: YtxH domain-containing protein [Patescibacteria group bacterium]|nr:YtxH domain-containing protein [Patescibacteria group bacterium]
MDYCDKKNKSGSSFFNGFIWGAVMGAGVCYFLTTKTGKKLIKKLTTDGLEGVTEVTNLIREEVKHSEEPQVQDDFEEEAEEEIKTNGHKKTQESPIRKITTSTQSLTKGFGGQAKRFFKGIPKRS